MNKKGKYSLIFAIFIACILMTGIAVAEKGDTKPECKDKIDNDGDGLIDRKDGGCTGPNDNDESNCGDGECEGGETSSSCLADCGVSDSCSDTDGGNAITVFGTTSGYLDDVSYSNTDSCVDSSTIKEYYCSGSYEYSASQSCGSDTYSSNYCSGNYIYKDITDYFCSSGECDNTVTSQVQDNCDSYDASGTDYCSNGDVYNDYTDYYCSSGACD